MCIFYLNARVFAIVCSLRWKVALVGELSTGHCSPRRGKIFQVREVHQVQELICDRSSEEEGQILAYFFGSVTFWIEYPVLYM